MPQTHVSQTLDRGLQILEFIVESDSGMTVVEVGAKLGVHRTIARRLITTLEQRHFLMRSADGRFRLGARTIALSANAGGGLIIRARPFLVELNKETGETVHLAVPMGAQVLFVDGVESPKALRVTSRVGRTLPAHATSVGKALLATLPDEAVKARLSTQPLEKSAPRTNTSRSDLLKEIQAIRTQGYATSLEASEAGIGSVGVAIIDRAGVASGAISIAAPVSRLEPELQRFIARAVNTARKIEALM